jgi:hypothetical protein
MRTFLLFALLLSVGSALTTISSDRRSVSLGSGIQSRRLQKTAIFSTPEEPGSSPNAVETPEAAAPAVPEPEEENKFPIDLPSPLLLSTSMILGIAGTGKTFVTSKI